MVEVCASWVEYHCVIVAVIGGSGPSRPALVQTIVLCSPPAQGPPRGTAGHSKEIPWLLAQPTSK